MAIDPYTKQLLDYEDKADHLKGTSSLEKMLLADNPSISLHNDKHVHSSKILLHFLASFLNLLLYFVINEFNVLVILVLSSKNYQLV